jgi:hypothetical protein
MISDVFCEAVVLLGFALHFAGETMARTIPFYAAAIALMMRSWPERP